MAKTFKAAVVGMGGIGNTHATCIVNDPLAELIAVCDMRKERADAAAEKFGVPAFYSLKEMLNAKLLVTVGDFENDVSMLQAGDISYAVENALPNVKAVAMRQTVHYEQHAIAAIVADLEREL